MREDQFDLLLAVLPTPAVSLVGVDLASLLAYPATTDDPLSGVASPALLGDLLLGINEFLFFSPPKFLL
jgi:hypothetical protein